MLTLAKWTSLSDIYGRKVLLQFTMVALAISNSLVWFAASSRNPLGYRLLYIQGALSGITSSAQLINPAVLAYIGIINAVWAVVLSVAHVTGLCFSNKHLSV